jgi:hypothetical protein
VAPSKNRFISRWRLRYGYLIAIKIAIYPCARECSSKSVPGGHVCLHAGQSFIFCTTGDDNSTHALQITAAFFFYFVVDGIITENVFELLAAVVLDALVLARVLFYVIAKKRKEFPGRIVLLSGITLLQVVILVCRLPGFALTLISNARRW